MVLSDLEQFIINCIEKEVPFPKTIMTVVIDDFNKHVIPEIHQNPKELEITFWTKPEKVIVKIIPPN